MRANVRVYECTYVHLAALCACLTNDDIISRSSFPGERAIFTHRVNAKAKNSPLLSYASRAGKAEWKGKPEGEGVMHACSFARS